MFGFSLVWLGQFVSIIGSSMTRFGLTIWAWQVTGKATALALVGFFSLVPMLVLSPIAGAVVDRWNRKRIMILGDLAAGLSTIFLLTLFLLGKMEIWHIYLVAVVIGAGEAFQRPAYMAAISTMIPKKHYGRAQGMIGMVGSATGIISPVAAGALLGFIGINGIMLIDIATFLFAISMLLIVRVPQPVESEEGKTARGSMWRESAFGFKFLLKRKPLLYLLMSYAVLNLVLTFAFSIQSPMILARTDSNELLLGAVQMFFGLGGVAGGAVLSIWGGPKKRIRGVFLSVIGAMLLGPTLLGLGNSLLVWAIGAFFAVFFAQLASASSNVVWQTKVPHDVQGRVFAYRGMIASIASPVGMILAGTLADYVFEPMMQVGSWGADVFGKLVGTGTGAGMGLMMVLAGCVGVVLGLTGLIVPSIRNLEKLIPDCDPESPPVAAGTVEM
ncbi:MAG: MFS transporter [Candidatus Atribacteria bacterium]|nr:MAG: MFS transporter [Candidatus Atribacteria bacterium]